MSLKLAVSFVTFFVFISAFTLYLSPVAAISIDSDASIELQVNRFNKVIKVEGYDETGINIVRTLSYNFKDYEEALEEIIQGDDLSTINVTVSCDNQKKLKEMEECITENYNQVNCSSNSYELVHEAHEYGVSTGMYKAYLELVEEGYEFDVDDISTLDKHEFHDMVKEEMKKNNMHKHNQQEDMYIEDLENEFGQDVENSTHKQKDESDFHENKENKENNGNKENKNDKNKPNHTDKEKDNKNDKTNH